MYERRLQVLPARFQQMTSKKSRIGNPPSLRRGNHLLSPSFGPNAAIDVRPVKRLHRRTGCGARAPLETRSVGFRGKRAICRKLQLRGAAFQTDLQLPEVRIIETKSATQHAEFVEVASPGDTIQRAQFGNHVTSTTSHPSASRRLRCGAANLVSWIANAKKCRGRVAATKRL